MKHDTKSLRSDIDNGNTPTARALLNLRAEIEKRGAGAITKTAQEVLGMNRSELSRLVAPETIRRVAKVEQNIRS